MLIMCQIVLTVLILGLVAGCSKVNEVFDPYPSDDLSIESFNRNKDSFERLAKIFGEDSSLWSIDATGNPRFGDQPALEPSEIRKQEYIKLMKTTGVRSISRHIHTPEDKSIYFQMWWVRNGPFIGSKSKYIVYKDGNTRGFVASLDEIFANGRDANESRQIDADWSLYLDVW